MEDVKMERTPQQQHVIELAHTLEVRHVPTYIVDAFHESHAMMAGVSASAAVIGAWPVWVAVPWPRNDFEYAVALHEFGHALSGTTNHPVGELVAWGWARTHARHWTPDMCKAMAWSLDSYREHLGPAIIQHFVHKMCPHPAGTHTKGEHHEENHKRAA